MRNVLSWILLMYISVCFGVVLSKCAKADDWHVVDLSELSLTYRNYAVVNDKARNMLIYPEHPKEAINVGIKMDLLTYGYFDSTIESLTTGAKYQGIGLDTRLGLRVTNNLELGFWHHSQHNLDRNHGYMGKFPSEDAVEIRLYLFKAKGRAGIL